MDPPMVDLPVLPLSHGLKPDQETNSVANCEAMEITSSTQNSEAPKAQQIFILSGQSNMAGRGGVTRQHKWDGVVPDECKPHPSILRLSSSLRWEPAREPLHADIDTKKACGVGPGMAFANAVRESGGVGAEAVVGLVPCAVGGTAIKEWARGEHLYENMVKRAREAVKDGGQIKALLWYQGESDTSTHHDAEVYKGKMETLIRDVREDFGAPSLPIIQVAIASGDANHYRLQLHLEMPRTWRKSEKHKKGSTSQTLYA